MINRLWHVAIGAWIGSAINKPEYRHGLYVVTAAFLAYQILESWRKGDKGYVEVKELGIGLALPLVAAHLAVWVGRWRRDAGGNDGIGPIEPDPGEDVNEGEN